MRARHLGALALGVALASCGRERPARPSPASSSVQRTDAGRPTPQSFPARVGGGTGASAVEVRALEAEDATLPSSSSSFGLPVPSNAVRVVTDPDHEDFRFPDGLEALRRHVRANLALPFVERRAASGYRYIRVQPRGAPADASRLYVLILPFPRGGALLRVQVIPTDGGVPDPTRLLPPSED